MKERKEKDKRKKDIFAISNKRFKPQNIDYIYFMRELRVKENGMFSLTPTCRR